MRTCLPIFMAFMAPTAAHAATVTIDTRGADGRPLVGAIVLVDSARKPAAPIKFPWAYAMAQRKVSFEPHVLIVPVGAAVSFPNFDKVRHHVYSFSKAKRFSLKLYGKDETRSVLFDQPGIVALGCNIHDAMSGFIMVVETPYAAATDEHGRAVIMNVPPGGATVRLWHPSIRAPGSILAQRAMVPATGFATTYSVGR